MAQGRGRACKCQTDIGLRFNYFGIEVFFFLVRRGKCRMTASQPCLIRRERGKDGEKKRKIKMMNYFSTRS